MTTIRPWWRLGLSKGSEGMVLRCNGHRSSMKLSNDLVPSQCVTPTCTNTRKADRLVHGAALELVQGCLPHRYLRDSNVRVEPWCQLLIHVIQCIPNDPWTRHLYERPDTSNSHYPKAMWNRNIDFSMEGDNLNEMSGQGADPVNTRAPEIH